MKTVFVFFLVVSLSGSAMAQLNFNLKVISAEEVPEAVQAAQTSYFPGLTVNLWEEQTASGPENAVTRFVANFKDGNGQVIRARYLKDGQGTTATTYYARGNQLPSVIQAAAAENYPDFILRTGEKLQLLAKGTTIFRIRLRKGIKKLVVYVDSNGEEISRNEVPTEVLEEENAD